MFSDSGTDRSLFVRCDYPNAGNCPTFTRASGIMCDSRTHHVFAPYDRVRRQIRDSDLLLLRRRGLISIAGRGDHTHAAKAAWWGEDLFLLETRAIVGSYAVTLSSQVKRFPGRIDVYCVNPDDRWPEYDRAGAVRFMRRLAGTDYGYVGLAAAAALHCPLVRLLVRPETDDAAIDRRPPFCSHACAMADRIGGGVDPVPHLADRLTEPADLATVRFTATHLRWRHKA